MERGINQILQKHPGSEVYAEQCRTSEYFHSLICLNHGFPFGQFLCRKPDLNFSRPGFILPNMRRGCFFYENNFT